MNTYLLTWNPKRWHWDLASDLTMLKTINTKIQITGLKTLCTRGHSGYMSNGQH